MQPIRLLCRRVTWLAIFAMLALVMAPTISHALAGDRQSDAPSGVDPWSIICTVSGMSGAEHAAEPATDSSIGHFEHCSFCALGGGAPLPAAQLKPGHSLGLSQAVPDLFLRAPRALFPWRALQARAPPGLS